MIWGSRAQRFFAEPPWNTDSAEWLKLDREIAPDHAVRLFARLVDEVLDLEPLERSYCGRGTRAHRPDLMLKVVLYELHKGRQQPAQWHEDLKENTPVQWLTFGMKVSRSSLYEFRDRLQPFIAGFHQKTLRTAIDEGHTTASTAALDGTFVAANASRHRMLTLETVKRRLEHLDQEIAQSEAAEAADQPRRSDAGIPIVETEPIVATTETTPVQLPTERDRQPSTIPAPAATTDRRSWTAATTLRGRKRQREAYREARKILEQRIEINARRRKDKRKKPKQIRVAIGDPTAPLGLDKTKVFRPLYNVQTMTDVDTDLVLAFSTTPTLSDSGHLVPMIELTIEATGQPLETVLADSGYPSGEDLAKCKERNVQIIAPWNENSFTAEKRAKAGEEGPILKEEFTWDPTLPGYRCPQGHPLTYKERTTKQKASGESVPLEIYAANPADCKECPLKARCVRSNSRARTVRRQLHEELIDEMRTQHKTPEGRTAYKKRAATIERRFADLKIHRDLQRISGRTPDRAGAQIGLAFLAHNLVTLDKLRRTREAPCENPEKMAA